MHNTSLLKKGDEWFELTSIVRLHIFYIVIKLILYLEFELLEHWESLILCM